MKKSFLGLVPLVVGVAVVISSAAASGQPGLFVSGTPDSNLEATSYPRSLTAERFEEGELQSSISPIISSEGFKASCEAVELGAGELYGPYNEFSLGGRFGNEFSECEGTVEGFEFGVTVAMNSCEYVYSDLEPGAEEGAFLATVSLRCSETGGGIKVYLPAGCTVTIPPQTFAGQATVLNRESETDATVGLAAIVSEVQYTATSICSYFSLGSGTRNDGRFITGLRLHS